MSHLACATREVSIGHTRMVCIDVHVVLRVRHDMRVRIPRREPICSQPLESRDHAKHALYFMIICCKQAFKCARRVLNVWENQDPILHETIIQRVTG